MSVAEIPYRQLKHEVSSDHRLHAFSEVRLTSPLSDSDITSVSSRSSRDTHTSYQTAGEDSDVEDGQEVDVAPIEQ